MALTPLEPDAVLTERSHDGQVGWIIFNRPKTLNAITMQGYKEIARLVDTLEKDEKIKVIAFKGSSNVFSSGQDVAEAYNFYFRDGESPRDRPSMRRRLLTNDGMLWGKRGMTEAITYSLKATVAVVERRCFGAGLDILMGCDIAVCDDECIFGHPGFTYHGFGGDLGSYLLHMGPKNAKAFTLTSRPFGAEAAKELGLVNSVVPKESLAGEADQFIRDIIKLPADAIVMQKAYYRIALDGMGMATNLSAALQAISFASNVKYDSGDNVMVRDRSDAGVSETIKRRKEYYGHM
jgi:enoyl-CoA hydratase